MIILQMKGYGITEVTISNNLVSNNTNLAGCMILLAN